MRVALFARAGIVKRICLGDDPVCCHAQRIALSGLVDEVEQLKKRREERSAGEDWAVLIDVALFAHAYIVWRVVIDDDSDNISDVVGLAVTELVKCVEAFEGLYETSQTARPEYEGPPRGAAFLVRHAGCATQ